MKFYYYRAILRYQPGDFILHTPGLHDKEKLIEITKVMNNTYPDIHLIPEPAINWKIQLQVIIINLKY